mmetsp:Transcript_94796/g.171167  ORF Transcript_94796/g.171167 Transcript_94796/m.171167 type:complete len:226 (+) Transcript_94796:3144-3821(+)
MPALAPRPSRALTAIAIAIAIASCWRLLGGRLWGITRGSAALSVALPRQHPSQRPELFWSQRVLLEVGRLLCRRVAVVVQQAKRPLWNGSAKVGRRRPCAATGLRRPPAELHVFWRIAYLLQQVLEELCQQVRLHCHAALLQAANAICERGLFAATTTTHGLFASVQRSTADGCLGHRLALALQSEARRVLLQHRPGPLRAEAVVAEVRRAEVRPDRSLLVHHPA